VALATTARAPAAPSWRTPALVVLGCVVVAAASLAISASPAYDVWAWLVWGREVGHLDLATVGGPSWKPFPVVLTTGASLAGSAAPTLWLLLARTANLLALVGVYRLGARLAGAAAGLVSAVFLVLAPDGEVRFLRVVLEGHTAAMTAALAVWAIECHLLGRRRVALFLVFLLALDRPEAWGFLLAYAAWSWRNEPRHRWYPAALLVAVPVLWFGGDWWGSGSPWHGAVAARVVASDGHRLVDALARVVDLVPWIAWFAAGSAVVRAARRQERLAPALAALAAAWTFLVVVMSAVFGYAALSRFLLPAAALVAVLAGAGAVWAITALWRYSTWIAIAVIVVALVSIGIRVAAFPALFDELEMRDHLVQELDPAIERAGGVDAIVGCGAVAISSADVPRVALAWKLAVPMARVERTLPDHGGIIFVGEDRTGVRREARVGRRFGTDAVTVVARSADWTVLSVACGPSPTSAGLR
jgi:hypothetical protein